MPLISHVEHGDSCHASDRAGNEAALHVQGALPHQHSHLLPTFSQGERYPPLEPFDHVGPGPRTLAHLDLAPRFGSDIRSINLATVNAENRDQLASHVAREGVVVFGDQG